MTEENKLPKENKPAEENTVPKENTEVEKASEKENPPKPTHAENAYDWLETVVAAAFVTLLIFTFIGRIVTVEGNSMNPTLIDAQRLVISDMFFSPETGDIVVIQKADSPEERLERPIVKRVIATGGQQVKIDFDNWKVYVDGEQLDEDYIYRRASVRMNRYDFVGDTLTVPDGYLFVMGDNRNDSADSRYYAVGLISETEILGHVVFRLFPFSALGVPQ